MGEINLLTIKPNKLSRDLRDYVWGLYGASGIGKTTLASRFENALICAFEKGYLALAGVMAQDVNSWSDFKKIIKQLKEEEVKKIFKFIFIDTADIAWDECEKYICRQEGVEKIGDIPYGAGYKLLEKEFFNTLKTIIYEGYGLGWISHSEMKTVKYEGYEEFNKVTTTLSNKARKVLFGMSDVVIYGKMVRDEQGDEEKRIAFVRDTSKHEAKSRFKYMRESFPFTYEALVEAFNEALDKEEEEGNATTAKLDKSRYEVTAEEKEEEKLQDLIEQIKEVAMEKKNKGISVKDVINPIIGRMSEIKDVAKAKDILEKLKVL